jgi:hypothetical protein
MILWNDYKKIKRNPKEIHEKKTSSMQHAASPLDNRVWYSDSLSLDGQIYVKNIFTRVSYFSIDTLSDPLCILDKQCDGILGLRFLSYFNFVFDEKNNLLYVKPNKRYYGDTIQVSTQPEIAP